MSKINKDIQFIIDMFNDLIDNEFKCNRRELVDNGSIFYFNSTNGTKWDWNINNHISTLASIYVDGSEAIKVLIFKDGCVQAYYYKKGSAKPDDTLENNIDKKTAKSIASLLFTISDRKDIFDKPLEALDIVHELTEDDINKFEDEDFFSDNLILDKE